MNRILVVLSTCPSSLVALDEATKLAKSTGSRICLVTIASVKSRSLARTEAWLRRIEQRVPAELRDGAVAFLGPAPEAIAHAAEAYRADRIVIGSRAYGALLRIGAGSSAIGRIAPDLTVVRDVHRESDDAAYARASTPPPRSHAEHTVLEATTLAGAAAGAVTGAIASPIGALIGGAIGTAIGFAAGRTLESVDDRAALHEHALDDAIGVTQGPIGRRGSDLPLGAERVDTSEWLSSAASVLRQEHQRLEQTYEALSEARDEGDWDDVRAAWASFEPVLRQHLAIEESRVFPAFRATNPAEAQALLAEHADLRRVLDELAIDIELHIVTRHQMNELIARLRAHGRREDALLYPWLDAAVDRGAGRVRAA